MIYTSKNNLGKFADEFMSAIKSVFATRGQVGSPVTANYAANMTDHNKVYVYTGSEAGYTNGNWYYWDGTAFVSGGTYNSQALGDGTVTEQKLEVGLRTKVNRDVLSTDARLALLALLEKVAYISDDAQTYYDTFEAALMNKELVAISAVFTQGANAVLTSDSLDDLKQYLVVTATFDDSTTAEVHNYTLSGTLAAGTDTITVAYGGETDTFTVVVSQAYNVCTVPMTMATIASTSWDNSTQTGTLPSTGASSWGAILPQNLTYQYSDVSSMNVRFKAKVIITGVSGSTEGSGLVCTIALYNTENPANNSSSRIDAVTLYRKKENGTFFIDERVSLSGAFSGSGLGSYYFGFSPMINATSGCTAVVSEIKCEVY